MKKNKFIALILTLIVATSFIVGCEEIPKTNWGQKELPRFKSGEELLEAFKDFNKDRKRISFSETIFTKTATMGVAESMEAGTSEPARDYSETNIQVEGVDEADIIKTDGNYIYTLANNKLVIARAYPSEIAEILSTTDISNFNPTEIFIHNNRLLIFGYSSYNSQQKPIEESLGKPVSRLASTVYSPRNVGLMSVKLYSIEDKEQPELLRTVDFEGNYLTSRKIGSDVYFVVNSNPNYYAEDIEPEEIIPLYKDSEESEELKPIAIPTEISYIPPIQANNFITIASISMTNAEQEIEKEVIVGNGQNVYASLENLYIAQTSYPSYNLVGKLERDFTEKTVVSKFKLDNGEVEFAGSGDVKGHILNQFSMDEYDDHFRIATTTGQVSRSGSGSSNNIYVLDKEFDVVGELEDLAPGEKIYSVRFMGKKGYVVTFKKVDPLFVIDLEDHNNPKVLGKLKIPGYSDYLHPYDETHLIGIGKETIEAEQGDFAWYQGVKMAIFDVTDVENPIELHKVVIGDRGTDSPVLRNHKAFLFDKEKELLVIPISLVEIQGERTISNQYGQSTFQGAYVYKLNLEDGFDLRGRISHYDGDGGYYPRGGASIERSLYINNVLYTLSNQRLQLNDLESLERLKVLDF